MKVCGLRDAATAQAAAEAGADAIGFVFAESVRQVTPAEANNAARQLPAGTLRVARGTILGANAVLLDSTGEDEIWAGIPARCLGYRQDRKEPPGAGQSP